MSGKCIIVPREQELMAGCPWNTLQLCWAGSAQGTAGRSEHTAELWAGRGREHNSSLYCTFRVSLLGRDMEHLPPLAWVGTPSPKQPFPKPPDLSHTDLHIPSVKENMGLGVCGFDKYVD